MAEGQARSPPPQQQRPPGGPAIGQQQQTMRSPPPMAAPVAQPVRKPGTASSKTLPATSTSSPSLPQRAASPPTNAASPPPKAATPQPSSNVTSPQPPIASSSLASFYSTASGSGSTATSPQPPRTGTPSAGAGAVSPPAALDTSDQSGPEGQPNVSASAYYAAMSAPTPQSRAGAGDSQNQSRTGAGEGLQRGSSPAVDATQQFAASSSSSMAAIPSRSTTTSPMPVAGGSRIPSILETIAAKFSNPPVDLTANPARLLIKEGFLARQATFKNVPRYCYLFSDLFIVTEPLDTPSGVSAKAASKKLGMKQVVALEDAALLPGKKAHIFIIDNPEKQLWFEAGSEREANEWVHALSDAIAARKQTAPVEAVAAVAASQSIFTAIAKKDEEMLLYLLSERGDDANQTDSAGRTPLHRCVIAGFVTGVTLLLSHGADPAIADADGKSSLHLAALNDQYAILLIFLSRKPSLDSILDMDGRSPLWDLVAGPYGVAAEAATTAAANAEQAPASSPLSKSGRRKKPAVVQRQQQRAKRAGSEATDSEADDVAEDEDDDDDDDSESGALSPSEKDARTVESIQRAAWENLTECLVVMIDELHVDLEAKDRSGQTLAMHLAAEHSYESLQLLMEHGASLASIDRDGATALHYAVCPALSNGHVDEGRVADVILTVQLLLQAGVCPNLRNNNLDTPLHLSRSVPVAGCLIVHGARTDLKNAGGIKAAAFFEDFSHKGGDWEDAAGAIKDAREQWLSRPDTFLSPDETLEANSWLDDELSDCCLLCSEKFSLTKRRHHCRRCGMLVCSSCSTKKFSSRKESGLRACDGCYNFMAHKYMKYAKQRRRAMAQKREEEAQLARDKAEVAANFDASHKAFVVMRAAEEERIAAKLKRIEDAKANPDKPMPPPPAATRRTPAGASSSSSSSSGDARTAQTAGKAASANQMASENVRLAQERGEKLSQMENKAAAMEADAENFASMAKKLKEKHKNSWF